ncbi:MAG: O-antigen ligase family protein [Verrucomicrobiales bacterium]
MRIFVAFLLGIGIFLAQILYGGAAPIYAYPGYVIIALAGLLSIFALRRQKVQPSSWAIISVFLFFGWIFVRAATSDVSYLARFGWQNGLACLVLYLIVALVTTDPKSRSVLLWILFVAVIPNVLIGLVHFFRDNEFTILGYPRPQYGQRASGLFICPNHFAGFLEVMLGFAIALMVWSRAKIWQKLLLLYFTGACLLGVVLSGSRGGYLSTAGMIFGLFVLCIWLMRGIDAPAWRRITAVSVMLLVLAGAGGGWFVLKSDLLQQRFSRVADTSDIRIPVWQSALRQAELSPVVGTGAGTFHHYGRTLRDPKVQSDIIYAHNDYLQLLAEYGAVGVALGLLMVGVHGWLGLLALGRWMKARRAQGIWQQSDAAALTLGSLGALGAYVIHSVFDFNLHIAANAMLMAVVFGILANPGWTREALGDSPTKSEDKRRGTWVMGLSRILVVLGALGILAFVGRFAYSEYHRERGRLELKFGSPTLASLHARQALEHDPGHAGAALTLGDARREIALSVSNPAAQVAMLRGSVRALEQGIEVYPFDIELVLSLALSLDLLGDYEKSFELHQRAEELDPNLGLAHAYRGLHFHRQGKFDEAEDAYRRAVALGARGTAARSGLRELQEDRKRFPSMIAPEQEVQAPLTP